MPLKERIILAAVPGAGKTYATLTIARALPQHKFYIIDPDDGVRRVWYNEFPDVKNIEYYLTPRWFAKHSKDVPTLTRLDENCYFGGIADAFHDISKKIKVDDWLSIEMLGNIWALSQDGFVNEIFDKGIGEYFLEARKGLKEGSKRLDALKGWTDWQVINKMHNDDFLIPACFELPCHIIMTTSIGTAPDTGEDPELKAFYGDSKLRLEGQKHNPFRAQTILILTAEGKGKDRKHFMATFIKDRGRIWIEKTELYDFYLQYLCVTAGWK